MKVFADTNFLISAFISRGLSADVLEIILSEHELVISTFVLNEFLDKMESKLKFSPASLQEYNDFLSPYIAESKAMNKLLGLSDREDEQVVFDAMSYSCSYLITGDKALIEDCRNLAEIDVLSPRGFWEILSST